MNQIYEQKYLKYKSKYLNLKNQLKGGNEVIKLKLENVNEPYQFRSLGLYNRETRTFRESTLFPIGSLVNLENGKFPLDDYRDLFQNSRRTHTIGGIVVEIIEFVVHCQRQYLESICEISVRRHVE